MPLLTESIALPHFTKLMAVLVTTGGIGWMLQDEAIAQVTVNRDPNTGSVSIDKNAYTLDTGNLNNDSGIPIPSELPAGTAINQAIPVIEGTLAPNSVILGTDAAFIRRSFSETINGGAEGPSYTLQDGSIQVRTGIDLRRFPGNHSFGEGIRVRVLDADNNPIPDAVVTDGNGQRIDQVFVRGDDVTVGPNGTPLNESEVLFITYGEGERVELNMLNIRANGADASESGVYFDVNGDLIVEDFEDGGDRDFNDGEYLNFQVGRGEAIAIEESLDVSFSSEIEQTPLAPETREESFVEQDVIETIETSEEMVNEERIQGNLSLSEFQSSRLGHAVGVRTDAGEQLVYNRYASTAQIQAGSDGFSATGQLSPLIENPSVPPTLFTGELTFNPWVGDGQAGLVASAGVTQFLNRTHRTATDALGNRIEQSGQRLVEPTGLLNNRRLVGYVPTSGSQSRDGMVQGTQLISVNGIFSLPSNRAVVIAPPDAKRVGRGNAAYTDNVGGLIAQAADGSATFIPQWTKRGYQQTPIMLAVGEASRLIYALVPQQPGQSLRLGESYEVAQGAEGYRTAVGGFKVISADQQPQNFLQEMAEVYAVEDTVADRNAATPTFNGIQGVYVEPLEGERSPTVDLDKPDEVDARVGNTVMIAGDEGQSPYTITTRAAGFYISGSLTAGVGNQQDTLRQTRSTIETATDQRRIQQVTNLFSTPVIQVDETTVETTTTTQTTGLASFEINPNGLLANASFSPTSSEIVESNRRDLQTISSLQRGEETLIDSTTETSVETVGIRQNLVEQDTSSNTDSYANISSVQGALALGGVLNFGHTPWSPAANTVRAELFFRETVLGRGGNGSEAGWRAEVKVHPFGEQQREAYRYDEAGNVVPLYQTEPVLDASGQPVIDRLIAKGGKAIALAVNQFITDEAGDRLAQMVGTGRSKGPGFYARIQDVWNDGESVRVDGGIQFSF